MQNMGQNAWLGNQRLKGIEEHDSTSPGFPVIRLMWGAYCARGWVCSQPLTAPHSGGPHSMSRQTAWGKDKGLVSE